MMTSKYKVSVGSSNYRPWEQYSREDLEYSAREHGFSEGYIEELTDQQSFEKIISRGCKELDYNTNNNNMED